MHLVIAKRWSIVLMPLASNIYQLMSNVQLPVSNVFIHILECILAHKKMMSIWLNNSKNICLIIIVNTESLIRENMVNDPVKENGQTESIMLRIILMFYTNM